VFTETAGKAYAILATRSAMKSYLKAVVLTNTSTLGKFAIRAQAEPGVKGAFDMATEEADAARVAELMKEQVRLLEKIEKKDLVIFEKDRALLEKDRVIGRQGQDLANKELELYAAKQLIALMREEIMELGGKWEEMPLGSVEGFQESEEKREDEFSSLEHTSGEHNDGDAKKEDDDAVDEVDEKMTELYWKNQLCMFAIRWHNEIIAEKCCIINGAFVTKALINGPHSTPAHALIFAIFYSFEVIADWLLVYVLVKYFDVPFLNLPSTSDLREPKNCLKLGQISFILLSGSFSFLHAFFATEGMFSGDADVSSNSTIANATLANVTDISMIP
jgi:hypothetical protein